MNFDEYLSYFEDVLNNPEKYETYQNETYYQYAKINWTRMNRWLTRFEPSEEIKNFISSIEEEQHWIIITEAWCGDAAHSVPQIYNIVKDNPNIDLEIQLRDNAPFLIDDYLTDGGKSIPKLIIRNDVGHDKAVWGPRPEQLKDIFKMRKEEGVSFDSIKEELQKWYNKDKGQEIQRELLDLLG